MMTDMNKSRGATILVLMAMVAVSLFPMVPAEAPRADVAFVKADIDIDNSYAVTEITAKFENPFKEDLDDTVSFQVPEDAFISNFSLTVGGNTYYAKIMPKEEAKERFDQAREEGKNAGLVSSRGKNTFSYAVNIGAGESVTATLRYEDFIERSVDGFVYDLGLTGYEAREIGVLDVEVDMEYDRNIIDLGTETYTNDSHIALGDDGGSARVLYRSEDIVPTDNYIVRWDLEGLPEDGRMIFHQGRDEGYFLHVFNPGVMELGGYIPKDIVFVLDKSGSMSGDKIAQVKDAFDEIIGDLRSKDRFNIVTFSSSSNVRYDDLTRATRDNRQRAKLDIESIEAGGGTNINEGLKRGVSLLDSPEDRMPIVVFLTDGRPTSGETDTKEIRNNILKHNKADVSIYCLGFGNGVNFGFLKALSLENGGHGIRIYPDDDAGQQITDFYDTISLPLLRNADFGYPEDTFGVYPTHVENLYEGGEIVIVGKYRTGTPEISYEATTMTGQGPRDFTGSFDVEDTDDNEFLERYWAYAMIRQYMDRIAVEGETDELVSAITNMSLEYGFVTDYTSLFVEVPDNGDERGMEKRTAMSRDPPSYATEADTGTTPSPLSSAPGFEAYLVPLAIVVLVPVLIRKYKKKKNV